MDCFFSKKMWVMRAERGYLRFTVFFIGKKNIITMQVVWLLTLEVNPKGKLYLITLYSIIFESHIRVWKCGLQFKQKSPAHNLNVSHQSGKNSFQKNLLFIAEDHTRLKARRRESQFFLPFLLALCLTSLLSLRSYVHKHKPETIFPIQFLPLILSLFRYQWSPDRFHLGRGVYHSSASLSSSMLWNVQEIWTSQGSCQTVFSW